MSASSREAVLSCSARSGVSKAAAGPVALVEGIDDIKAALYYRNHDQLGDSVSGLNFKGGLTSIPAGDHDFTLVITVDETHQVPKHNSVFVSEP